MARWQPFSIAGGAYSDDARPWSVQDTVNYLPVPAEREGTRSPAILRSAPGFTTFSATMKQAPIRGLHNVEGLLLAVAGDTLYRIGTDGLATAIGTVPGVRRVTMAHNQIKHGHEVVIANGQSGYLYRTTDGTFQQITDPGFPGFKAVGFVDGYIAGIEPAGRFWLHSDLLDAGSYNTLDRYDAEAAPDKMVALVVSHREVMVLSERSSQFFRNVGGATGTFANSSGTEIEVGCASTHAVARLDNTVYWLGHDGIVYRLAGHQPQRVSTGPIEQAISRCNMANAFAFTFEDRGHKVFYLTFPDGHTWGFDVWSGEWHRRQSQGFDRWRLSSLVKWNGKWIGGDFANGRLYQLDWAVQHEAGAEMEKRRITPVLHDNQNRVTVSALELVVDVGLSEDSPPLPAPILAPLSISGDLPDGFIGESVTGAYTASGGVLPHGDITVVSGTFPPGLTLNADGTYSGSCTTEGSYSWTVQVEDAGGNVATLNDACVVTDAYVWMLSYGSFADSAEKGKFGGDEWASAGAIQTSGRVYYANGVVHVQQISGSGYSYSTDGGDSWITANLPSRVGGSSDRVVHAGGYYFVPNAVSGMWRRPENSAVWSSPSPMPEADAHDIATHNGKLFNVTTAQGPFATRVSLDCGDTWAVGGAYSAAVSLSKAFLATNGDRLIVLYSEGGTAGYASRVKVSDDDGATWSESIFSFASPSVSNTPAWLEYMGDGRWLAGTAEGMTAYSHDDGDTWTAGPTLGGTISQFSSSRRGRWMAACHGGLLYSSDDYGVTWGQRTDPAGTVNISGIAWIYP